MIAAGAEHTCLGDASGVRCFGMGELGQLGDGSGMSSARAVIVTGMARPQAIVAGGYQTCALAGGGAWCWGRSGDVRVEMRPAQVALGGVQAVGVGGEHACALAGNVFCWGAGAFDQLGNGAAVDSDQPAQVVGVAGASAIAAGGEHTCVITGGELFCWGRNALGQLGDGTRDDRAAAVRVLGGVTAVAAGGAHTCAVGGGSVRCWGNDATGQLGDGAPEPLQTSPATVAGLPPIVALAAGGDFTCALDRDGGVWCWGANEFGQLGNGIRDPLGQPAPSRVIDLPPATQIAAGGCHVCAATTAGVRCWGRNHRGQLGDGTHTDRPTPIAPL